MNSPQLPYEWRLAALPYADMYLQYHIPIEFVVLTLLFVSLARATLKHRLPDPPGKVVAITVGLALAASLTLGMARWGISLLDLSILPLSLLAVLMFTLGISLHRKRTIGLPVAIGVAAIVFGTVLARAGVLNSTMFPVDLEIPVIFLAVLLVMYLLFGSGLRREGRPGSESAGGNSESARRRSMGYVHALVASTRWVLQRGWGLLRRMKGLVASMRGPPEVRPPRDVLKKAILDTEILEAELKQRLKGIRTIAKGLERTDAEEYRDLSERLSQEDASNKPNASRGLIMTSAMIRSEHDIQLLTGKAEHHVRRIKRCLSKAEHCMDTGKEARAERWMDIAVERQKQLLELLTKLAEWEHRLERIVEEQNKG